METFVNIDITTINITSGNWSGLGTSNVTNSTDTLSERQKMLEQIKGVMFMLQYITLPLFLVAGLFGNILTILTMASKQFSHLTSRYLLIALAISDTTLLLTQPFNKLWVIKLFGTDLRAAFSDTGCKLFFHIFKTGKMTSSWLVVLLCFERFVAVVFPLKAKFIIKKWVIFLGIALDYIVIGTYNAVWSFSSGVVGGFCKPDLPHPAFKFFIIGGCTLYSFLPAAILLVMSPQIMFRILLQVRKRRSLTSGSAKTKLSRKEDEMIRASIMVVAVMIAYIILVLPITVVHLYAFLTSVSAFDENDLGFFIFREIAQMLEQVNYSINFFFYVLCSSTFRRRVFELLGCFCCWDTSRADTKMVERSDTSKRSSGTFASSGKRIKGSAKSSHITNHGTERGNSSEQESSSVEKLSDGSAMSNLDSLLKIGTESGRY